MSITLLDSPNPVSLSGDYLYYRMSSSNSAQSGFRIRITVDVNGTERYSGYHFMNSNDKVIFDVSSIIDDLVDTDPAQGGLSLFRKVADAQANMVVTASTNAATVVVSWQEYYSDALQGSESSDTIHVVKGYGYQYEGQKPDRDDLMTGWQSERTASGGYITAPMLRDMHLPIPVLASYAILDTDASAFDIGSTPQVRLYNGTTQLSGKGYQMANALYGGGHTIATTPTDAKFLSYLIIDRDLLVSQDSTLTATEWDETATHIEVQKYQHSDASVISPILKLEFVDDLPCKHEESVILWWNRYGGFDWMVLDSRVEKTDQVERKTRRIAVGNFDGSDIRVNEHRGNIVSYGNVGTTKVKASTVSATTEDLELARSCQRSRQVLLWHRGSWRPVVVDSVDFPYSKDGSAKMRPIQFSLTMADEQRC